MPFAANDKIAQEEFSGSIEITDAQYAEALDGMCTGLLVTIDDGFKVVAPPPPDRLPRPPELEPKDREVLWRYESLAVIARQLQAIEEDEAGVPPSDLLPGTRQQWLKYRGQVSNWNDADPNFPEIGKRPVQPA